MGLNTVRLEGKQEHPFLFDLADELGIMILAGWECCDKWEGWSYNDEVSAFPMNKQCGRLDNRFKVIQNGPGLGVP